MAISTAAALIGSAVIGAGTSLFAGGAQADAAGEAAALSAEATRLSVAEQRRQFKLLRGDLAPYRETGTNALAQYAALYGIGRGTPEAEPGASALPVAPHLASDPLHRGLDIGGRWGAHAHSDEAAEAASFPGEPQFLSQEEMQTARDRFMETPGYQFRFDEGIRALDRSASASGRLRGGGYTRELQRYGQGIASAEFENYANRLSGIAGMGQGSTVATGTLGAQSAGNIGNALQFGAQAQGNALMAAGTARASGYAGAANAATGGVQNWMLANYLGGT